MNRIDRCWVGAQVKNWVDGNPDEVSKHEKLALEYGLEAGIAHGRATPDREMLERLLVIANDKIDSSGAFDDEEVIDEFLSAEKDLINREKA